ncbi:GTPase family protein [Weissella confusa]|uniref:GTP-binding protein n=1 Tax=Weissella confusa TaxID=1583 RepID=A0A4Z0S690_WEICO|nr:GTPase [Weissella confusa]TGE75923.1 GTP-binding protein [Weissella confusa]
MEETLEKQLEKVIERTNRPTNILFVGATGSGKSSTINALFNNEKAKVGFGADPETKDIQQYELGHNLTLWDSPGFGDSKENDRQYAQQVMTLLQKKDADGKALIDLVVVIADNGSRDLGTVYQLISNVIINNLAEEDKNRVVVALNKTDLLAGGNYWNKETNRPEPKLELKIIEKEESVRNRIYADTKINPTVLSYTAGYSDEDTQQKPWQLIRLLSSILAAVPVAKRLTVAKTANPDAEMWKNDENYDEYTEEADDLLWETIKDLVEKAKELIPFAKPIIEIGKKVFQIFPKFMPWL